MLALFTPLKGFIKACIIWHLANFVRCIAFHPTFDGYLHEISRDHIQPGGWESRDGTCRTERKGMEKCSQVLNTLLPSKKGEMEFIKSII